MPCVLDPLLLAFSPFLALRPPRSRLLCPARLPGVPGNAGVPARLLSAGSHRGVSGGHFSCPTYGSFFHSGGDPWEPGTSPYVWARGQQGTRSWPGALTEMAWGGALRWAQACVCGVSTPSLIPRVLLYQILCRPSCPAACPFAGLSSRRAAPKQPRGARVRAMLGTGGQAVLRRLIPNPASSPEVAGPLNPHQG